METVSSNIINFGHKITYNDPNLFEKFDIIKDEEEKQQFRNIIYNYDLLMIFNLQDFLEEIVNEKISQLHDAMIKNNEFRKFITTLADNASYGSKDTNILVTFMLLFSYDNLHLFYPCICEFLEKGIINKDKLENIKNNIF
jgi:hypothetical protein